MVYKGHIKNGAVVLDDPVKLPEGAEVDVAIRESSDAAHPAASPTASLSELFSDLIDSSADLPPDAARHKRHYLYGHRKS